MLQKYPRTPHLHTSPGLTSDDKLIVNYNAFENQEVVVTLKLDGENTTFYKDYVHARSLDSKAHDSRTYIKALQGQIGYQIPEEMRICGENLFATHSIHYTHLPGYFLVFNIWDRDYCLPYEDTLLWCEELLGLPHTPCIYRGEFNLKTIQTIYDESFPDHEGYVIRTTSGFNIVDFPTHVAKYVKKNFVQTSEHWMSEKIIPNKLRDGKYDKIRCWPRSAIPTTETEETRLRT